jgi:hypothetical protein
MRLVIYAISWCTSPPYLQLCKGLQILRAISPREVRVGVAKLGL